MSALEIRYELPLAIVIAGLILMLAIRAILAVAQRRVAERTARLLREHGTSSEEREPKRGS